MAPTRLLAVSMRRADETSYAEPRDAIARDWWGFLRAAFPDVVPLLLPNDARYSAELCRLPDVVGLVLTGGDDVGSRPERDEAEDAAFREVDLRSLPVLGVCRGMQFLVRLHGGEILPCDRAAHVARRHGVRFVDSGLLRDVNSFHGSGVRLAERGDLEPLAHAEDGELEAVRHRNGRILGIMWHPEREIAPIPEDLDLVRSLFRP